MNKKSLFMTMLTAFLMSACSQDDPAPNGEDSKDKHQASYMAVNLVSSDVSRALAGYEDGTDTENHVNSVRFYFFTENGVATDVKLLGNNYVNFYDWTPVSGSDDPKDDDQSGDSNTGDDIESNLKATIVINTKSGDKIPQKIAAVLNPTGLDNTSKNLDDLKKIAADYMVADLTKKGSFVMFNSIYGVDGKEFCAVPIEAKHLCKTEDDAIKNPVTIYVERSVAKVKVALSSTIGFDSNNRLALKDKEGKPLLAEGQQVYLMLGGWGLTADTDKGRLVKKISTSWTSDWWNGKHRSFWAINADGATNRYHDYTNSINTAFGDATALYTNENAAKSDATGAAELKKTKVILKGTLCKGDGTPLTLVRHLGSLYADTYSENAAENLPKLKTSILSQLSANGYKYYYENGTNVDGEKVLVPIETSDLRIEIANQLNTEDSKNNCYVYSQLTEDAQKKTWYISTATKSDEVTKDNTQAVAYTDINTKLKDKEVVDWPLVWKSGMTYYYYEIIHNNSATTVTKGVVRNHVYKTTVTKIAGLGTPVYDPSQLIYPEQPGSNDHYIAAEIKILSWRIVDTTYELNW